MAALLLVATTVYCQPGSLDLNFDADGKLLIDMGGTNEGAMNVLYQPDGKIIAAGSGNLANTSSMIARLNPDGSLDNTFGIAGKAYADLGAGITLFLRDAVLQPDGKIVQAGYSGSGSDAEATLFRYTANGFLDNTFSTDGIVTVGIVGIDIGLFAVAMQPDGKIVGAGLYDDGTTNAIAAMRFNADGSVDNTFSFDGIAYVSVGVSDNFGHAVGLQSDGKILVCGTSALAPSQKYLTVTRFTVDGLLDNTFGTNGTVAIDFGQLNNIGTSVEVLPDNKILVAGNAEVSSILQQVIAKLLPDGTLDPSFGVAGLSSASIGTGTSLNHDMTLQQDGKILLAAVADNGTDADFGLLRFDVHGNLDPSFDTDGKLMTDFGFGSDQAMSVVMQDDGLILVSGTADVGSENDFALARYISGVNMSIGNIDALIGATLIYPNPVINSTCQLEYELNADQTVSVELYSADGKWMANLMKTVKRNQGYHQETLDLPNGLSSGNYFIRIAVDSGIITVKATIN